MKHRTLFILLNNFQSVLKHRIFTLLELLEYLSFFNFIHMLKFGQVQSLLHDICLVFNFINGKSTLNSHDFQISFCFFFFFEKVKTKEKLALCSCKVMALLIKSLLAVETTIKFRGSEVRCLLIRIILVFEVAL